MFGVLIIDKGEDCYSSFKIFDTLEEAKDYATNVSCMSGLPCTIFDYDKESKTYIEFYEV